MIRRLALAAVSGVLALAGAELLLRALEPAAPALSRENRLLNERLLRPDPETGIHLRSGIDVPLALFWPDSPVRVRTNATGQRMDRELPPAGAHPATYRIATLGDSSTMGWGVEARDAYPTLLEALLGGRHRGVEVLNFGTIGFSSHNGLAQLESRVLALRPDLVTLAFGFNDGSEQQGSDAQRHARLRAEAARRAAHPRRDALVRRLRFLALGRRLESLWLPPEAPLPPSRRVPPEAFAHNLERMLRLAREAGAQRVLLDLNLPNGYGRDEMTALAGAWEVPLLDCRALLREALPGPEPDLAARFGLASGTRAAADGASRVVFRAYVPPSPDEPLLVRPRHDRLFDPARDEHAMFDDGTHGDEVAGDRVFSLALPRRPGGDDYALPLALDLSPAERRARFATQFYHRLPPPPGTPSVHYAPVHRAGENPLRPFLVAWDAVHPNEAGHRRIARALAEIVGGLESFRRFADAHAPPADEERWFERRRRYFER